MTLAFDFHPEAQAEFAADVDWYDAREPGLGGRFADAVRAAIDAAVDDPAGDVARLGSRAGPAFEGCDQLPLQGRLLG